MQGIDSNAAPPPRWPRRVALAGALLLLGCVAAFALGPYIACWVVEPIRQGREPPPPAGCGNTTPTLTAAQIATAEAIAANDPRVLQLLGVQQPAIDSDPWTGGDGRR